MTLNEATVNIEEILKVLYQSGQASCSPFVYQRLAESWTIIKSRLDDVEGIVVEAEDDGSESL